MSEERYFRERARIEQGHVKYRDKLKDEGKLFVRDRLTLLLGPFAVHQLVDRVARGAIGAERQIKTRWQRLMQQKQVDAIDAKLADAKDLLGRLPRWFGAAAG